MKVKRKSVFKDNILTVFVVSGVLLVFLIFQLVAVVILATGLYGYILPNPSVPKIPQEEFDFKIIYAINGEEYCLQDTFVCEFDGFEMKGTEMFGDIVGKKRAWKGYIKSTGDEEFIIYSDKRVKIYCCIGDAGYYMGDPKHSDSTGFDSYLYDSYGRKTYWHVFEVEESDRICDVQLISFEIEKPIKNRFRYTIKSIFTWVNFS